MNRKITLTLVKNKNSGLYYAVLDEESAGHLQRHITENKAEQGETLLALPFIIQEEDKPEHKKILNERERQEILKQEINKKKTEIKEWVLEKYRPIFKKVPNKPKRMGDRRRCIHNLAIFTLQYPQYSKEQILQATEQYVKENARSPYIRQADYFVFKEVTEGGVKVITSDLLSLIEDSDGTVNFSSDGYKLA